VTADLAAAVTSGDRRALARAITLVESTRPDHRQQSAALLDAVLPATGRALRVAVTGAPGAGKSTLTEALGLHVLSEGHRLAVLAIDPSSQRSGGSILGDKTRMEALAKEADAFIRPSPSGGTLGGVARRTREALLLCEAAGFDVVFVETVGVGQSETAASDMVDCTMLVVAPGGGDELQGIKRGIMELADVVVVNKADGDLRPAAQRAAHDLRTALHLMPPKVQGWSVPVIPVSALQRSGLGEIWEAVRSFIANLDDTIGRDAVRGEQAVRWMWSEVRSEVLDSFHRRPEVASLVSELVALVRTGSVSATAAAHRLLSAAAPHDA